MVRQDACADIRIQPLSPQEGGMAVYYLIPVRSLPYLIQKVLHSPNHTYGVHDLSQPQYARIVIIWFYISRPQDGPRLIQPRGRHAGRHHNEYIQIQSGRCLQHIVNALAARHIANLMGIGNDCRRAMGQDSLFKLRRGYHGTFQVDMSVNEPRAYIPACHVHIFFPIIFPDSCYVSVLNGYIGHLCLLSKNIHDCPMFQDQGCLLPAGRYIHHLF